MRAYVDNSVLTTFYTPEPLSALAIELLTDPDIDPAVSNLTQVEFFSATAKKVRRQELDAVVARRVRQRFVAHLEAFQYTRLPMRTPHFRLAADWLAQESPALATLDALHLAAACLDGRTLLTADQGQAKAAEALGVDVKLLVA